MKAPELERFRPPAALLLILSSCIAEPPAAGSLSRFMELVHDSTGFAGAVVVERWGEPIFEGGWGLANRQAGLEFSPDTPADGASLAKTLVAAGVWELQAEGRLDLEDRVEVYVPSFPHEETRLRHLLEHSAGIAELDDPTGLSNAGVVEAIAASSEFAPGTRFSYCNECFDILALVIERVTGESWGDFIEARYLGPLGMDSTFIRPALLADWKGVRTRSYRLVGAETREHDVYDNEPFYGSSNLYLSARDLAQWGTALVQGRVLEPEVMRVALERPRFPDGAQSALNRLNWFQGSPDGPAYFDGHLRGFHSVLYWDPTSGLVVAWVSNVLGGRPMELQLTRELVRIANGGLPGKSVPSFPQRAAASEVDPMAVQGSFHVPSLGDVSVEMEDGIILVRLNDGAPHPGYPLTGYFVPNLGVELGFSGLEGDRYSRLLWLSVFDSLSGIRQGG